LTLIYNRSKIRHVAIKYYARWLCQHIHTTAPGIILLLTPLLLTTTLTSPATASTDEVRWAGVNIPAEGKLGEWVLADGSDIQCLEMAIDGALYAYGKGLTYTLYKSTNGGYSWSYIGDVQDDIVDIATTPNDADTVYYTTSSTLYKSADGGNTFDPLPSNPGGAGNNNLEITCLAVTRLNDNIIAVGTRDTDNSEFGGVYTLDEGDVIPGWTDTNLTGYDAYAVAFSPNFTDDRQLTAAVTNETDTFVTTRIGDTGWGTLIGNARLNRNNSDTPTPVSVAESAAIAFPDDYDATFAEYAQFVAIDTGSGGGDVYKIESTAAPDNSAATDLNIGADYGRDNIDVTGLAVTGNTADACLLAGTASGTQTYFSNDGGDNWTVNRKEPTGETKTWVLMAPDFLHSGKAYAATSGNESAFSISNDSGNTWNQFGLIDTNISTIVDLAPSPGYSQDNTLFMLTFGGASSLWRSQNAGSTWERIFASSLPNVDSLDMVALSPQYGKGIQVIFIAGSSNGNPAIWKSTDNSQCFTRRINADPATGNPLPVDTWVIMNDTSLIIGSYDGSNGKVYQTSNSGFFYSDGEIAGSQPLNSLDLSPNYEQDGTIIAGNNNGWVYLSDDNGNSFEPLPPTATSPPLSGSISVAFDPQFSSNQTVYAASNTAGEGVYRFTIGSSTEWKSIDSTLPSSGTLGRIAVSADGTLYSVNTKADGGMERCLNPTYSLGPVFETVTRGLENTATLCGLWQHEHRLWSIDTTATKLMTFTDSLTSPVTLTSPADSAAGTGTLINETIRNVSLDWETLTGATGYQWQLDYDNDFSSVPGEFEGDTKASSARLPALEPATTYYWRVRAISPLPSPWTAKRSFTTSLNTESNALRLESPEASASSVPVKPIFQWDAVPGAIAYELIVSSETNLANPVVLKIGDYALPATAWQCNVSLNYDTTYYWKVAAISTDSRSAWSAVGAFTTETAPPPPEVETPQTEPPQTSQPIISSPLLSAKLPVTPSTTPATAPPKAQPDPTPELAEEPVPVPPPPTPPSKTANTTEITPDWVIYLIGFLLLIIVLMMVTMLVLVSRKKHG